METGPNGAERIAFLGFGEAAQAFLKGWRTQPAFAARVVAYDVKTDSPDAARARRQARRLCRGERRGRREARRRRSPARRWSSPSSPPTRPKPRRSPPCPASPAARSSSTAIPARRRPRRARPSQVEAAGGRYVDVAVMSPVHPRLHRSPLLHQRPARRSRGGGAAVARHGAEDSRKGRSARRRRSR